MNTAESHDTKSAVLNALSMFLTRYRTPLLAIVLLLGVAVVGLFVALEVAANRTERSLELIEALQGSHRSWLLLDQDQRVSGVDGLISKIEEVVADYPRVYAAQRAIYIRASMMRELGHWEEASKYFVDVADQFPNAYLAPVSLTQAAVAAENDGDQARALDILIRLLDEYGSDSAEIPRALFSIGRINEGLGNTDDSVAYYTRLINDHPGNSWTNLARDRIITIAIRGRIGS